MKILLQTIIILLLLVFHLSILAQKKIIAGLVKDGHSDEALPFSSISFKNTNVGKISDSAGEFHFQFNNWPSDTLMITSISYQPFIFVIPKNKDSIFVNAVLQAGTASAEVVVKSKHGRGWYLWRKVVAHRNENNIFKNDNFSYHVHNRLEIDLYNINSNNVIKSKVLKPFSKIISSNIDSTSEEKPILPTFLSETISDYYFQKYPHKTKEIIRAHKISGVKNESITKYLGAIDQNVVVYGNFIPVFDKEFVSPFHPNGDLFYNYRLADMQKVNGRRLLHLIFIPKYEGQNTFTGDCWIDDSTAAIQKILLHLNKNSNINFVDEVSIVQEFSMINDSTWFLKKDKFYITLMPLGSNNTGFIARKTTNYKNILLNTHVVKDVLEKNKLRDEVLVLKDAREKDSIYWDTARLEKLSKTEEGIYRMIDTIQNLPSFKKYYKAVSFLGTGYMDIGKFQIGPWASWISSNVLEGTRIRFDLGTNKKFSKNIYLYGYMAYGFKDQRWKQKAQVLWMIKRNPWQTLSATYTNDLNFSQNYNTDLPTDNVLAVAFRKSGIPIKLVNLREVKIQYFKDSKMGLSATLTAAHKNYDPLLNLPDKNSFTGKDVFNTTEFSIKIRWSYLEKFFENTFFRYSTGSGYPVPEIEFTQGVKGILNSNYSYQKVKGNISDEFSVAPFGKISYNVFAGKIYGTLPYLLLEIHPGNEVHIYNKYAFSLMNRYEFVSDKFAGFSIEQSLGKGLFRFIPVAKILKWRQFWNVKGVTGSLSNQNKDLNFTGNHSFKSLDNKLYLEVGTGVDNILKVLRLDLVWRVVPTPLPENQSSRFGVFGSFKIAL